MQDMADAQWNHGAMPSIAPEYTIFGWPGMNDFDESPEWGSALIILPHMYNSMYGDDTLIRQYYRQMQRYIDYLGSRADHHIISFGLGDWYDYGDFRAGFSRNTPVPLVATAHYYYDLTLMTMYADMLNNKYDVDYYQRLSDDVKKAFNNTFLNRKTAEYGTGSQCSNALPLFLDLPDSKELYDSVLRNLVLDIEKHGNRLTTGEIGNRYLIQSLAQNNKNELIYKMFNHYDAPGYGYQLKFGATTLTEQWDPRYGASWNHFMLGQIDEWFFRTLAGFSPTGDGMIYNTKARGFAAIIYLFRRLVIISNHLPGWAAT
jgi:hypothetical protein